MSDASAPDRFDEEAKRFAGDRVLLRVEHINACTSCEETFADDDLRAFDPEDNDHCPGCDQRGTMTTYYGDPDYRMKEYELGVAEDTSRSDLAALLRRIATEERTAGRREAIETAFSMWSLAVCAAGDDAFGMPPDDIAIAQVREYLGRILTKGEERGRAQAIELCRKSYRGHAGVDPRAPLWEPGASPSAYARCARDLEKKIRHLGDPGPTVPDQHALAGRLARYKIRRCYTMHACALCDRNVADGQLYHDGGYGKRAHTECVDAELALPAIGSSGRDQ